MTSTTGTHPLTVLAGSPLNEKLLELFNSHLEGERELIEAYAEFRDRGPDHVRYLVDLILKDEARHHQTFAELVNRLRSDIDFDDYGPQVPYLRTKPDERDALVAATERFLAFEHEDARSLKHLQKELRPVRNTTLFSLLVKLVELDTKKHIAILEFIRHNAIDHLK